MQWWMVEVGKEFLKDKDDFSSRTDASINTSSTSVIRLVKQTSWVFLVLKSSSHFLPQSTVS